MEGVCGQHCSWGRTMVAVGPRLTFRGFWGGIAAHKQALMPKHPGCEPALPVEEGETSGLCPCHARTTWIVAKKREKKPHHIFSNMEQALLKGLPFPPV